MIRTLGVVGGGQMGGGIAHVAAATGCDVVLVDVAEPLLAKARAAIEKNLDREVAKGKRSAEEKTGALSRLALSTDLEALAGADAVVEAIVESEPVKKELFGKLDRICKPDAILASNTSSISITRLAASTGRPDRFIGMHFMNPVPVMALVEVIRGMATSDGTAAAVDELARRMGKTPIVCNDYPGFVSNRVLMPMINEAIETLREGVATKEADRRDHEARDESPDGAPAAGGLHRPRHVPGDPARAAGGLRRPEVPAEPAARPHGRRRLARQQVRPRLLRVPGRMIVPAYRLRLTAH